MSENRRDILEMLAAGKITADEAERLMRAMDEAPAHSSSSAATAAGEGRTKPKYIRVVVESSEEYQEGPTKVNIRVPIQLLRAGVKLAGLIPLAARDQINHALQEHGVQADISKIKPDDLEELVDHLNDLTVDVDETHNKVRIFCE
jgi:hypothetical protein